MFMVSRHSGRAGHVSPAPGERISLMPHLARSVENVPHSRIRELAEIAMSMDGVLRLYFGESNLPTPDYIKRAAVRAMRDGYTFYTENAGLPSLRRAIAENYRRLHRGGDSTRPSEIVVTASGVQALNVAIRCALDPGDEALVLTPAWPNGTSIVHLANAAARADAAPAVRRPLPDRFRRARSRGHAAHAPAGLHFALESAGLGGHRRGPAAAARFRAPPRICGCWPTKSTTGCITPARAWASRRHRSCAWPRATTR